MSANSLAGLVVWITGLSGAGKSTVGRLVADELRARHPGVIYLDGDVLRAIFSEAANHDRESRLQLARRYGLLCRELSEQGAVVICATISMFHEVRTWNRRNLHRYLEVYLRVPLPELERRDPKGLYARARRGEIRGLVGLDQTMEEPQSPDLVIDNHGAVTSQQTCAAILQRVATATAAAATV